LIKPPRTIDPEDRNLACQEAMEEHFVEIMEAAEAAGWSASEAATAIIELADNYLLKLQAIGETDAQIREACLAAAGRLDRKPRI